MGAGKGRLTAGCVDLDELSRLVHRWLAPMKDVGEVEDRRRRTDADRQSEDDDQREARCLGQRAKSEAKTRHETGETRHGHSRSERLAAVYP